MAFLECKFASAQLGKACCMNIILPQNNIPDGGLPVVYLLHGLSDDYTAWCRYTSIERYANACNCAVVMPDGGRSFYTDAVNGGRYWSFISEELPEIVTRLFPISTVPEKTFAAGLSMGGYGALKLALLRPEKFAAAAALSPVVNLQTRFFAEDTKSWQPELLNIFGSFDKEKFDETRHTPFNIALNAVFHKRKLPRLLSICGTDDFMIADNRRFNADMLSIADARPTLLEFHSFEYPGSHNWEFWDTHIRDVMAFFFENRLPEHKL